MAFGDKVQSNSGTSTVATTSPTLGSGVTSGNLIVLTFAADDYNGTPNTGWTQSSEMEQQTFHGGYLWWFIATSNGQAIPSYTIGSAVRSAWTLVEYAGPFDASPYDGSQGVFQQSSSGSITSDALTPTSGDRLLIGGLQAQHSSADLQLWGTITGSFTVQQDVLYNGGNPRLSISQLARLVTANGSTSYTVGGTTPTQVSQSRSANIIAFKKGAAGSTTNVSLTVSSSSSVSNLKSVGKRPAVTSASSTASSRSTTKRIAVTSVGAVAVVKSMTRAISVSASSATSAVKNVTKRLAASATSATAIAKQVGKIVAVTAASTTAARKNISKALAVTASSSVSAAKAISKFASLVVSSAISVSFPTFTVYNVTVNLTAASAVTVSKVVSKTVSVTASASVLIGAAFQAFVRNATLFLTGLVRGPASLSGETTIPTTLSGVANTESVSLRARTRSTPTLTAIVEDHE